MSFLFGIFWLIVVMAMIYLYVAGVYLLFMAGRKWYRTRRRLRGEDDPCYVTCNDVSQNDEPLEGPPKFWLPVDRKRLRIIMAIVVLASMTTYVSQRTKWMGADNTNLKAKEFWVSGQVLNGFRAILTTFIHPDLFILRPAEWLQRAIYWQGARQLPENDGEIGVWQNVWFNYHYCKKGRYNLGLDDGKTSDKMKRLLDQWWLSLEAMGSKPFADRQMEEEHYLRDYPTLAFWYKIYDGFYTKKLIASAHRLAQMPKHVERHRQLSTWLWELPSKWQSSSKAQEFNKEHPKIIAVQQVALLLTLNALIQGEIYERKFACSNDSIERYVTTRQAFMGGDNGKPAYKKLADPAQGKRLWYIAIDSAGARETKYVIKRFCGIVAAGKEDNNKWYYTEVGQLHNHTPDEEADHSAAVGYQGEIKLIEEQVHER